MLKRVLTAFVVVLSLAVVGSATASAGAVRPVSIAVSGQLTGVDTSGVDPVVHSAGTWAAQPVATPYSSTTTTVVTGLCAFPITVQGTTTGTFTVFTTVKGTQVSLRATEQDILSANGISLTGDPYQIEDTAPVESDGIFGVVKGVGVDEKVPLPGGGVFITAGFSLAPPFSTVIIPQKGATVNLPGLCAALA